MKPPMQVKENGRFDISGYEDEYYVDYLIKTEDSDVWQSLSVKTDKNNREVISISISKGAPVAEVPSWVRALLETSNQGSYCAVEPKTFVLNQGEDGYYYSLDNASKKQIDNRIALIHSFWKTNHKGTDLVVDVSELQDGPKFS